MENSPTSAMDWVLIESAASSGIEDDFVLWSRGSGNGPTVRAVSGASALVEALQRTFSRRVVLDFQLSFERGLNLIRTLKAAAPEMELLVRVDSARFASAEPLYFSVDVRSSGVCLNRVGPGEGTP